MDNMISVSDLCKSYTYRNSTEIVVDHNFSDVKTRCVLDHIDLTFPVRKISILVGRSGCGKSTLLRIMNGDEQPDSGKIEFPEGWHTTMLTPLPYVITWTSVKKNVELAAGAGRSAEERTALADWLLAAVHLTEFADQTPEELSTGMRQRLGLARVLASRSEVLLMDEPFASLDFITREELQNELLAIQEKMHRTILLVTHQLEEAVILGNNITVMHRDSTFRTFDLSEFSYPRNLESAKLHALSAAIRDECRK